MFSYWRVFPHLQTWGDSWRLTASPISPDRPATSWRITSAYVQTKPVMQAKCGLATGNLLTCHICVPVIIRQEWKVRHQKSHLITQLKRARPCRASCCTATLLQERRPKTSSRSTRSSWMRTLKVRTFLQQQTSRKSRGSKMWLIRTSSIRCESSCCPQGNWAPHKWTLSRFLSSGEREGALQGGSVHHGLQARQRTSRLWKSWSRRSSGKTLEKTRQQEQEGESEEGNETSGCLETAGKKNLYLQIISARKKRNLRLRCDP